MSEHTAEKDAPWCGGSMRPARRSTDVGPKPWGVCRRCNTFRPLALQGLVKPHRVPAARTPDSTRPVADGGGL